MSLAEDIIASHAGVPSVTPRQLVDVSVDRVYLQDGNTPTVKRLYEQYGFDTVFFSPDNVAMFFDHAVLAPDARISDQLRDAEQFGRDLNIPIFRRGTGISHVVALEQGWFAPGDLVVASDSHTCTGGVTQCLALGMGATDVVAVMVTGRTWLRVPETVWVEVIGQPGPFADAKDVGLCALGQFGVREFLYTSVEWHGPWFETLSLDAGATFASLTAELGAKCTFLPPAPGRPAAMVDIHPPDGGARRQLDVTDLPPFVSRPHLPSNAVPVDECAGQEIDYVFVGSCTNGRYEDLRMLSSVLDGNRVDPRVHLVVTPGSLNVYLNAVRDGLAEQIARAGGLLTPPGCGACVGTQGTIPASGARIFSTMNRNFRGRMGNPSADIWLGSPFVAGHTALLGRIPAMSDLG